MAKEKPPIFGMLQRGGEVVIRMQEDVKQVAIGLLVKQTITEGGTDFTDEDDIYSRLEEWGYGLETVCHAAGEYARYDGYGFCEVHVNTLKGFWSLLRSWLRPHLEIPQESLPPYLGFFEFVHNVSPWQEAVGRPSRPIVGTTPESILSRAKLIIATCPCRLKEDTAHFSVFLNSATALFTREGWLRVCE